MARDTFDAFLQKQVRRVRQSLRPAVVTRDDDFVEEAYDITISSRGNTKGRMGHKCPSADSQEGVGGLMPGKRRREIAKEDRAYWDYYKAPTTGARFPWK